MRFSEIHFQPRPVRRPSGDAKNAFSLVEVLVVVALLSFIVVALMGVFSSTQAAWRSNMTQTDVLESGRATADMIAQDLAMAAPSGVNSNSLIPAINLWIVNDTSYAPLVQPLVGGGTRTNVLQNILILSRNNNRWYGTGYAVCLSDTNLYSLYRYGTPAAGCIQPSDAYNGFINFLNSPPTSTNSSHLLDGVVHLAVRTYDASGFFIATNRVNIVTNALNMNGVVIPGYVNVRFYSNSLPASVEIEIATLEDRVLQRADSFPTTLLRDNYLRNQAGKVHVFRQRVPIRNFDPAAYP